MTKLNEISELLKQAEAKVASLKAEIQAMEYDPTWKPVGGDCYYSIGTIGRVAFNRWDNDRLDTYRLRCNDVFKTKKEAELYLKIFNRVHELNEQDPVDWGGVKEKHYLFYNFSLKAIYTGGDDISKDQGKTYMTEATKDIIRTEFTDKELEVWVRR